MLRVFTKMYFSGFNVESLGDTLEDFIACNQELALMFDLEEDEDYSDSDTSDTG